MIAVAACESHEEAVEVAGRLGVEMRVRVRGFEVYVARADYPRAALILNSAGERPGVVVQPLPFHPCPKCHTPDPIWFGKRKAIGIFLLVAIFMASALLGWETLAVASLAAIFVFVISARKIPEFECRNCRHRWLKERIA